MPATVSIRRSTRRFGSKQTWSAISYGGSEYASERSGIRPSSGVVITASAGDADYYDCDPDPPYQSCTGPEQPASFANVVAAGGTRLEKTSSARGWTESVWNDVISRNNDNGGTGSGCSRLRAQAQVACRRTKGGVCPMRSDNGCVGRCRSGYAGCGIR